MQKRKTNAVVLAGTLICGAAASSCTNASSFSDAFNKSSDVLKGFFNKSVEFVENNKAAAGFSAIAILGIAAFVFIKKAFGKSKDLKEDENIGNIINENAEKLENEMKRVKRTELFEAVTGVSEEVFRNNKEIMKKCIKKDKNGNFYIVNQKTKEETCARNFKQYSIGDMDEDLKKTILPGSGGTFNVISLKGDYSGYGEDLKKKVDISALQANEENKGKVFVLASNFNALETVNKKDSVSNKEHLFGL